MTRVVPPCMKGRLHLPHRCNALVGHSIAVCSLSSAPEAPQPSRPMSATLLGASQAAAGCRTLDSIRCRWLPSLQPRHAGHPCGRRRRRCHAAAAASDGGPASSTGAVLPPAQGSGAGSASSSRQGGAPIPRLQGRYSYKMVKAQPVRWAWHVHRCPAHRSDVRRSAGMHVSVQQQPQHEHWHHKLLRCCAAARRMLRAPTIPLPTPPLSSNRWRCCRTSCAAAACPSGGARTSWHPVSATAVLPRLPRCHVLSCPAAPQRCRWCSRHTCRSCPALPPPPTRPSRPRGVHRTDGGGDGPVSRGERGGGCAAGPVPTCVQPRSRQR